MRFRITLFVLLVAFTAAADDVFIPIAGSVGVFRTDSRVFNPSFSEAITVDAYLLPTGNVANGGVSPVNFTVAPREMKTFDDVVSSLFHGSGLGGIRLVSPGRLGATARIFAVSDSGTLGQFVVGVPVESALTKGVLLQLKSSASFRTNVGVANSDPAVSAVVTLKLFDRTNMQVAMVTQTMPPLAVIAPTNILGLFHSPSGDLADCWISFESDRPVVAYGSVVDNGTTDPTYVPAIPDPGVAPPPPAVKEFMIEAFRFDYTVTPVGGSPTGDMIVVKRGDKVRLTLTAIDNGMGSGHGFLMSPFVPSQTLTPGMQTVVEFTAGEAGTFPFVCTVICGTGHGGMSGRMVVEP
ncbi:MAG: hypothetical protein WC538_00985 [Thermoanaerobaculia bacterium]|jgi:hypothetical protein